MLMLHMCTMHTAVLMQCELVISYVVMFVVVLVVLVFLSLDIHTIVVLPI